MTTKIPVELSSTPGIVDSSNATAITIDSNENVGIGTTSPASPLHIYSADNQPVRIESSDAYAGLELKDSTSNASPPLISGVGDSLVFYQHNGTDYAERMRIHSSGSIGIGTNSPNAKLHISTADSTTFNAADSSWHTQVIKNDTGAASNASGLAFYTSANGYHVNAGTGIACVKNGTNSDYGADLVFITRPQSAVAAERMRIDSSGRLCIGTTAVSAGERVRIVGTGNTSAVNTLVVDASDGVEQFAIRGDGLFATGVDGASPYNFTTSSAANVFVDSAGILRRSNVSSLRYKKDIANATWGLEEVKQLRPVTYKSNTEGEFADDKTYGGLIAEEVHDLGLTEFVDYNDSNEPDGLHYANMVSLLTKAIQEQQTIIEDLQQQINEVKNGN